MKRIVLVAGMAGLLAMLVVAWRYRAPDDDAIPMPETKTGAAPRFDLEDLQDPSKRVRLADYAGRPVVINFWASWCVPCREEIPAFREVAEAVGDRVAFVGIDHKDTRDGAIRRLRELGGSPYPSGFDPKETQARAYGLYGMPSTVFVSPGGRILGTHSGALTRRGLASRLDRYFDVTVPTR